MGTFEQDFAFRYADNGLYVSDAELATPRDYTPPDIGEVLASQGLTLAKLSEAGIDLEDTISRGQVTIGMAEPSANVSWATESFAESGLALFTPNSIVAGVTPYTTMHHLAAPTMMAFMDRVVGRTDFPGDTTLEGFALTKAFDAYNATRRDMLVIPNRNVQLLPEITRLQRELLPVVRTVIGDDTVEVSVDPNEATVINLQPIDLTQGERAPEQSHGAHIDRVDTTVIACLANVGTGGDTVFIKGLFEACMNLGIDPNGNFSDVMIEALKAGAKLDFQIIRLRAGDVAIAKTDTDVHFVTPKSYASLKGAQGDRVHMVGGYNRQRVLARGILNVSFETELCRDVFEMAKQVMEVAELGLTSSLWKSSPGDILPIVERYIRDNGLQIDGHTQQELVYLVTGSVHGDLSSEELYADRTP